MLTVLLYIIYHVIISTNAGLVSTSASSDGSVSFINYTFTGHSKEDPNWSTFSSSFFPHPYPMQNNLYVFNITTRSENYILLEFMDFDLHELSVLKLYDGCSTSSPSQGYRLNHRPVWLSSGQCLLMVFKPGNCECNMTHAHIGFNAKYSFVNYKRSQWPIEKIPSIGFCGSISKQIGEFKMYGKEAKGRKHFYDCVWQVKMTLNTQNMFLLVQNFSFHSNTATLEIREGVSSRGKEISLLKTNNLNNSSSVWGNIPKSSQGFYLRLQASDVSALDFLRFTYAESPLDEQIGNDWPNIPGLPKQSNKNSICPFKSCSYSLCYSYWKPCGDRFFREDGSCEEVLYVKVCDKSNKCYNDSDICDGWNDCGNHYDEHLCNKDERKDWWRAMISIGAVFSVTFVIAFFSVKIMKKFRAGFQRCTSCCVQKFPFVATMCPMYCRHPPADVSTQADGAVNTETSTQTVQTQEQRSGLDPWHTGVGILSPPSYEEALSTSNQTESASHPESELPSYTEAVSSLGNIDLVRLPPPAPPAYTTLDTGTNAQGEAETTL